MINHQTKEEVGLLVSILSFKYMHVLKWQCIEWFQYCHFTNHSTKLYSTMHNSHQCYSKGYISHCNHAPGHICAEPIEWKLCKTIRATSPIQLNQPIVNLSSVYYYLTSDKIINSNLGHIIWTVFNLTLDIKQV